MLVAACLWGPYALEPTDPPQHVAVEVVAYHLLGSSQRFTVMARASGQSWRVGAARAPFAYDYRGPAVLEVRRGRWTGKGHYRLLMHEPPSDTPNQAMQLTASKLAVYVWSVCRRERMLRAMHSGLAAADLVSR